MPALVCTVGRANARRQQRTAAVRGSAAAALLRCRVCVSRRAGELPPRHASLDASDVARVEVVQRVRRLRALRRPPLLLLARVAARRRGRQRRCARPRAPRRARKRGLWRAALHVSGGVPADGVALPQRPRAVSRRARLARPRCISGGGRSTSGGVCHRRRVCARRPAAAAAAAFGAGATRQAAGLFLHALHVLGRERSVLQAVERWRAAADVEAEALHLPVLLQVLLHAVQQA
eukprot:274723-Chlamydomonas_euryale.AAC.2